MSERGDYSDAEWSALVAAPVAVIAAVIGSSPNGPVGIAQEVGAAVQSFERAAETRRDNPLIAALLLTLKGQFERFTGKASGEASATEVDILALGQDSERAVAAVRAASELLAQKAPPALADELRAWLLELAQAVAVAANEGGFFGIGGQPVSPKEQAILEQITAALQPATTPEA